MFCKNDSYAIPDLCLVLVVHKNAKYFNLYAHLILCTLIVCAGIFVSVLIWFGFAFFAFNF